MTRRRYTRGTRYTRSSRSRSGTVRIRGVERFLFIMGALLYLIGVFGGINLLAMATTTAILLLGVGGGLLLIISLTLIF
jgi:cyanate permease